MVMQHFYLPGPQGSSFPLVFFSLATSSLVWSAVDILSFWLNHTQILRATTPLHPVNHDRWDHQILLIAAQSTILKGYLEAILFIFPTQYNNNYNPLVVLTWHLCRSCLTRQVLKNRCHSILPEFGGYSNKRCGKISLYHFHYLELCSIQNTMSLKTAWISLS